MTYITGHCKRSEGMQTNMRKQVAGNNPPALSSQPLEKHNIPPKRCSFSRRRHNLSPYKVAKHPSTLLQTIPYQQNLGKITPPPR